MNGSGGFAAPNALLNSPTALALMAAQLMPNGQPNGHVQSPLFNGMPLVSSPFLLVHLFHPSGNERPPARRSERGQRPLLHLLPDGTMGFFRRSIRKSHVYKCRFDGHCNVDKTNRNSCRACRLQRCLAAGMRVDAIQNERDVIGKRRRVDEDGDRGGDFLKRPAGLREAQLVLTVEWAKSVREFAELALEDQASLLKANATPLIVLGVAYRSLHAEGGIWLANDKLLMENSSHLVGDIKNVVSRIIKELVVPLRDLEIEATEFVALKGLLFSSIPYNIACSSSETYASLKTTRLTALNALRAALKGATVQAPQLPMSADDECRFGQLLLLLPERSRRLPTLTEVDEVMQALILHDAERTEVINQLTTTSEANTFHADM
ncbi:hypothetical protein M3Y99_00343100 [Aphelenchoides fujianensis]|nr:hypothetical protein M3Y99_00343100 [Aphelenchoides fujianensis]